MIFYIEKPDLIKILQYFKIQTLVQRYTYKICCELAGGTASHTNYYSVENSVHYLIHYQILRFIEGQLVRLV